MTQVYFFCAVVGGILFLIQFVLMILGMGDLEADGGDFDGIDSDFGAEGAAESGGDPHGAATFGQISIRTLVAFFLFFGLAGMWSESTGASSMTTIFTALGGGLFAFYGVSWVMRKFAQLSTSGNIDIRNAVGTRGRVYIKVPASRGGTGKVTLTVQQRTVQINAVTDGATLASGEHCQITGVQDRETLVIESLVEEEVQNV